MKVLHTGGKMNNNILFDNLNDFINEVRGQGITKIAFSETNEKRAVQVSDKELKVMHLVKLELLAYKEAVIYKCIINDADHDAIYRRLNDDGFEVKRMNRNIT